MPAGLPKPYVQCWAASHPSRTLGSSSFPGSPSADFMTHVLTTDVSCPARRHCATHFSPGGASPQHPPLPFYPPALPSTTLQSIPDVGWGWTLTTTKKRTFKRTLSQTGLPAKATSWRAVGSVLPRLTLCRRWSHSIEMLWGEVTSSFAYPFLSLF